MQDGLFPLLFAGTNVREGSSDFSFGVDVADAIVPPHCVASRMSVAADHVENVVIDTVDVERVGSCRTGEGWSQIRQAADVDMGSERGPFHGVDRTCGVRDEQDDHE